jgi:hypothetical protein
MVEPDPLRVFCDIVEGVKEVLYGVGDRLPLDVGEVTVDATWEGVTTEVTTGPAGAGIELDTGKTVAKEDARGGLGTSELL